MQGGSTVYNRAVLETKDLFDLVVCADELGVLSKLPTFVAAALDRIPSVKPEEQAYVQTYAC